MCYKLRWKKKEQSNFNLLRLTNYQSKKAWHTLCLFVYGAMNNPRSKNGNLRRKHRARMKALGLPCALCGRPIHYDEPSDPQHPWSFVIDEKIPVSRWKQYGYDSPEAVAQDWDNLQPAHYICNALKSNKAGNEMKKNIRPIEPVLDGEW